MTQCAHVGLLCLTTLLHKELWTLPSVQREALGRCFSRMVVVENGIEEMSSGSDLVTFTKAQSGAAPMSLLDGSMAK